MTEAMRRLRKFELDPVRGFLPSEDPLRKLPPGFEPWEELSAAMPSLLLAGRARDQLDQLDQLDPGGLRTEPELWRAFLLVSLLANSYIMGEEEQAAVLPRALAVPLSQLAGRLGVAPVFNYAAIVLRNWSRVDPTEPVELGNLVPLRSFLGGVDEGWFLMSMTAIEAKGSPVASALLDVSSAISATDHDAVEKGLQVISTCLVEMTETLARLSEKCDPYVFYHRVRPILDAWREPGVVYDGVDGRPQMWIAASTAECALVQALDATYSIRHSGHGDAFLRSMRPYMPVGHRRFIEHLEAGPSVREYVVRSRSVSLRQAYNENIDLLSTFRRRHMEISVRYVAQQARKADTTYGTSGTDFIRLLHTLRQETTNHLI